MSSPQRVDTDVQNQKAASAYFTSEQILTFGFAEQNIAVQSRKAAPFTSKQILPF